MRTFDCETTIWTAFKRKASPFSKENWVVTYATKDKGDPTVRETRFGHDRPGPGWFKDVLDGCALLVGFNLKFDILHAIATDNENHKAWMKWVAGGGKVLDVQLAEYLLNGMVQQDHYLSLDEVAPRYGGNVKIDEVKALWEAGVNTPDIEPALLSRYLCGGNDENGQWQDGDITNTEKCAIAQIARARTEGCLNKILLDMDSLIASIEMERNGMFVNRDRGEHIATELGEKVAALTLKLKDSIPADLPFDFNWGSRFHKSALIFGGQVMYEGLEYQLKDGTWVPEPGHAEQAFSQKDEVMCILARDDQHPQFKAGELVTLEAARICNWTVERYASGKNAGEIKTKKVKVDDYTKPKKRKTKYPYIFPRLAEPQKEWEGSDPGVYSTAADVIATLGVTTDIPFLRMFSELQALTKDLGTYYITTDEDGKQKGMLTLVDLDWIIHHSINHNATVTSRFSSSDPNLQNLPKDGKSIVKSLFESRWRDEGLIVQSDFTSLEVYVQAALSMSKLLIEDLRSGVDMHIVRASAVAGVTYEQAIAEYTADKSTWKKRRDNAKVFSFQRAYGAGNKKISDTSGMPMADVEKMAKAEDERYPEVADYNLAVEKSVRKTRVPTSIFVGHPDAPGVRCQLGRGYYRTPDGQKFVFTESPAPKYLLERGTIQSFSPTELKNYPTQGTGATWMKAAMGTAVREFYKRENFNGLALLVNTVHDAIYADAHKSVALEVAAVIDYAMTSATQKLRDLFSWDIPIDVPAVTTWGPNMMTETPIEGLAEAVKQLRIN